MREEYQYLSKLESVLKLRYEYSEARIQDELSKESIKKLNCALVTDHVVNENFTGIVKERLVEIKSIKNYHFSSIDQISQNFSSQSRKLKSIWKKHLSIKNYVTNCKFFTGCEFFTDWKGKIKENEDKYHISINIEEVEKHHVWIAERIKEKKVLEEIAEDVSSLYEILNSLPIFKGLLASAKECERRIIMAKTVEEVEKHHLWIADLIEEEEVLEKTAEDVSSLYEILNSLPIFKGLLVSAKECERRIIMAKTVEEIMSQSVWIADLIKKGGMQSFLHGSLHDIAIHIQHLSRILDSLPIFKKLFVKFKRRKNHIIEAKNMETINNHYIGFKELLGWENALESITCQINEFREYTAHNSCNNKWIVLLEKACANLEELDQISDLGRCLEPMKRTIADILNTKNMSKYLDKDRVAIIDELSRLESQSALDYNKILEIHNKLRNKFNHIFRIIREPYPLVDFADIPDFPDYILDNIPDNSIGSLLCLVLLIPILFLALLRFSVVFSINIFLVFFIWPFIYLIRKEKKYFSIRKPVLDW